MIMGDQNARTSGKNGVLELLDNKQFVLKSTCHIALFCTTMKPNATDFITPLKTTQDILTVIPSHPPAE